VIYILFYTISDECELTLVSSSGGGEGGGVRSGSEPSESLRLRFFLFLNASNVLENQRLGINIILDRI